MNRVIQINSKLIIQYTSGIRVKAITHVNFTEKKNNNMYHKNYTGNIKTIDD